MGRKYNQIYSCCRLDALIHLLKIKSFDLVDPVMLTIGHEVRPADFWDQHIYAKKKCVL